MTDAYIVTRPRRGTTVRRHSAPIAELDQDARRRTVGASEIATVLGRSEFAGDSRLGLFNEKTLRAPRRRGTQRMRFGLAIEQIIADEFAFRTGLPLEGDGRTTYLHPDFKWASATPDRFIAGNPKELVEIKNVGQQNLEKWGEQWTDEIPVGYKLQAQWQMFVMDADRVYVAAFIGGNELRIYVVERRQDIIDECVQAAAVFASHVERDIPPTEDLALDPTVEDLLDLYATNSSSPMVEPRASEIDLIAHYVRARRLAERAEKVYKTVEDAIKLALMDSAGYELPNGAGTVTYKATSASLSTDYEAIVRELGDAVPTALIAKHTTRKLGTRRFTPTMAMRNLEKLGNLLPEPADWMLDLDRAIKQGEDATAKKLAAMVVAAKTVEGEDSQQAYETSPIPEVDASLVADESPQ